MRALLITVILAIAEPLLAHPLCSSAITADRPTADILSNKELTPTWPERIQVFCKLKARFQEAYGAYEIKEARAGVNLDRHFDACIERESKIENSEWEHLKFNDRFLQCIAGVKDSHLEPTARKTRSLVKIGLKLKKIENRFFISAEDRRFLKEAQEPESLIGFEVLKVDGKDVQREFDRIRGYTSASSPGAVDNMAEVQMFSRNFAYPEKNNIELVLKKDSTGKTVVLPWKRISFSNKISESYLEGIDIPLVDQGYFKIEGFHDSTPLFTEEASRTVEFLSDHGRVGMRISIVERPQALCYVQLITFYTRMWKKKGSTIQLPFDRPIKDIVRHCDNNNMPIVLDLRKNRGGYTVMPGYVLGMLARPGEVYAGRFVTARNTSHTQDVVNNSRTPKAEKWRAAQQSMRQSDKHYPMFPVENIEAVSGGFRGKVIALVSPLCMSACDLMAGLLKLSGRATLVGSHTTGTGAGFWSNGHISQTQWADPYGQIVMDIPNLLFGALETPTQDVTLPFEKYKNLITENRPFEADSNFHYETGLEDILGSGSGWEEAALRALNTTQLP